MKERICCWPSNTNDYCSPFWRIHLITICDNKSVKINIKSIVKIPNLTLNSAKYFKFQSYQSRSCRHGFFRRNLILRHLIYFILTTIIIIWTISKYVSKWLHGIYYDNEFNVDYLPIRLALGSGIPFWQDPFSGTVSSPITQLPNSISSNNEISCEVDFLLGLNSTFAALQNTSK